MSEALASSGAQAPVSSSSVPALASWGTKYIARAAHGGGEGGTEGGQGAEVKAGNMHRCAETHNQTREHTHKCTNIYVHINIFMCMLMQGDTGGHGHRELVCKDRRDTWGHPGEDTQTRGAHTDRALLPPGPTLNRDI